MGRKTPNECLGTVSHYCHLLSRTDSDAGHRVVDRDALCLCDRQTGYWLCENRVAQGSVKEMMQPRFSLQGEYLIIKARCGRIRDLTAPSRAA